MKEIAEQLKLYGVDIHQLYKQHGMNDPNGWQDFLYDIQKIIDENKIKRLTITNYEKLVSKYMYDNTFTILYVEEEKDQYVIKVEYGSETFNAKLSRIWEASLVGEGAYNLSIVLTLHKKHDDWLTKQDVKSPMKIIKIIDSFITYNLAPLPF